MTHIYYLEKNDMPFYIGKTRNPIRRKHKHYTKYGREIKLCLIDNCEDDEKTWKFWENYWIDQFKSWGFELVNQNKGGGGPSIYKEEYKLKMRKPRKEGTGQKISKTLRERNHSKYYTPEVREKMSNSLKGRKSAPFSNQRKSNMRKGLIKSLGKKVLQYDLEGNFIQEFDSKSLAEEWLLKNKSNVSPFVGKQIKDCCLGKQKTCYGYIWRYKELNIVDTNFDYQNKLVHQFDNDKNLLNSFNFNDLLSWLKTKYNNDTSFVKRYKIFKACEQKILNKIMDSYWSFNNKI